MEIVEATQINTFGDSPKADAPPEDPIFVLTASQLRQIITDAVQPLHNELSELKATVTNQGEVIRALRADEKLDHDDIRDIFDVLASLERSHVQPLQKDRGEILRALIAANGGKMLRSQARKKMHLSESRFSELLATMEEWIDIRPYHLNESWRVLSLR